MIIQCRKMGVLVWIGCGALAASLTVCPAIAQTDNYDPSSRTRISYGMARDPQTVNQDNTSASPPDNSNATWKPARGTQQPPQPQRTYEAPRAGSR
ncbi:MAG TPA: hypothetical protein VGY55_22380, partial [Pirellulales bacterium]|nr:hypothetical protein [Pirellulales bacterium]